MNLVEIKHYLMRVKISSLAGLCAYFKAEPDNLRQLLNHWLRKGCVKQCMQTPACGTACGKCAPAKTEIYEWVGN